MPLTKKQFLVLSFLDSFIKGNGYCPSYDEIGRSLHLSSLATIHKHISNLERKGFIRRDHNQSRSIEVLNTSPVQGAGRYRNRAELSLTQQRKDTRLPLLGRIAAGRPLEAVSSNESFSLKEFVGNENVFVLQVMGNSMIDDHICHGDFVVVENVSTAESGDTVVVLIDNNEATLKKFFREKNSTIRLQPANEAMKPIFVEEKDLTIQGRVIAVLRKY